MGRSKRLESKDSGSLRLVTDTQVIEPSLDALDQIEVDAIVIGLTEDCRPLRGATGFIDWRLCGRLSALIQDGSITGAVGERVLTPSHAGLNAKRLFVFGWGPSDKLIDDAGPRFETIVKTLNEARVDTCVVSLPWPTKPLLGLVDEHLCRPLGKRLVGVFAPEM